MLDGCERVNRGPEAADAIDARRVKCAGDVLAMRVQVAAVLHGEVVQHRAEGRRDVVRLQLERRVDLDHAVLDAVQQLRAERVPQVVVGGEAARVAGLQAELKVLPELVAAERCQIWLVFLIF